MCLCHPLPNNVPHPKSTSGTLIFVLSTMFYFFSFLALLSLLHNLELVTLQPTNPTTVPLSINPLISLTSSFPSLESPWSIATIPPYTEPLLIATLIVPLSFSWSDSTGKTLTLIEPNSTCPELHLGRRL